MLGDPGIYRAKSIRVNVLISEELWAKAQARAEEDRITLSELARRALVAVMADLVMPADRVSAGENKVLH